ncbi:hypothetical protein F0U61_02880 [Archangium violaceum]|uniref:hypothetical protein n=1 Tax=Archangium violaceum TaxID=83451 RepID=UPI002B2C2846|nr:hypothetical protein F0U61_02880 [Archangium violaceum]
MSPETLELLADASQYAAVCFIGAFIGIGELISRYKDDPFRAIANPHAFTYTLVNVLAAAMALLALRTMPWSIGITQNMVGLAPTANEGGVAAQRIGQTLLAGFGAMGILRSSAFMVRSGDQDVAIGPSALLQVILSATDRAVDRARAKVRAELVAKTMQTVSFAQIHEALPVLAFSMMQNLSASEKEDFAQELSQIRQSTIDDKAKSICLGLSLSNLVGQDVLDAAVEALRNTVAAGGNPEKLAHAPTPPAVRQEAGTPPSVSK